MSLRGYRLALFPCLNPGHFPPAIPDLLLALSLRKAVRDPRGRSPLWEGCTPSGGMSEVPPYTLYLSKKPPVVGGGRWYVFTHTHPAHYDNVGFGMRGAIPGFVRWIIIPAPPITAPSEAILRTGVGVYSSKGFHGLISPRMIR